MLQACEQNPVCLMPCVRRLGEPIKTISKVLKFQFFLPFFGQEFFLGCVILGAYEWCSTCAALWFGDLVLVSWVVT